MGLEALPDKSGIIFIHDGARPFVTIERLHALAEACLEHRGAIIAVPVTDTIKLHRGNEWKQWIEGFCGLLKHRQLLITSLYMMRMYRLKLMGCWERMTPH